MSPDVKCALLGILNAVLITGCVAFQKLNAVRGGHPIYGTWLVLAFVLVSPTFFTANLAFALGGRVSVFIAACALQYVLIPIVAAFCFQESVSLQQMGGIGLIVLGVALAAFGGAKA